MYSRCTQFPLQQKENMPEAKSWNVALVRGECVPRVSSLCALIISTVFHIQKPSRALDACVHPAPVGQMLPADSRGRASARSGPAKPQWLPASVPAGVYSCLHDDLEPALFSGAWHSECSWRRMQRSHTTDALPSAGCSAPPWYRLKACRTAHTDDDSPLGSLFVLSPRLPVVCDYLSLLRPVVTYFSSLLRTCSCLRVTGCFCLYPAAGHELIMRTQGFSVPVTKLWHHHITHTLSQTHWLVDVQSYSKNTHRAHEICRHHTRCCEECFINK